jgi:hypothetical protein
VWYIPYTRILQGMSKKRLTVKATPQGLVLAQNALKRLGGTQLSLANKLTGSVGRSTIQKFFQGKEIQVNKFQEICRELLLESHWEAIAQSVVRNRKLSKSIFDVG